MKQIQYTLNCLSKIDLIDIHLEKWTDKKGNKLRLENMFNVVIQKLLATKYEIKMILSRFCYDAMIIYSFQ